MAIKLVHFQPASDDVDMQRYARDMDVLSALLMLYDDTEAILGVLDTDNLDNNASYTTGWVKTGRYSYELNVAVKTDRNVSLKVEQSVDGSTVAATKTITITANALSDIISQTFDIIYPYFRITETNNSGLAQTTHLLTAGITHL